MKELAGQKDETGYLEEFAELTGAISEYVQNEYLLPHKMPHWSWPEEQQLPLSKVGQWLHRLYAPRVWLVIIFPFRLWFMLAPLLSLILEGTYPMVLASLWRLICVLSRVPISSVQLSWRVIGALFLLGIFLLLEFLLPMLSAVGVYWILLELASNRRLARLLRLTVVLIALASVVLWVVYGTVRLSDKVDYSYLDPDEQQVAFAVQRSPAYLLLSAVLFYIPALSYGALWVTRTVATTSFGIGSTFHWLVSFHLVRPIATVSDFVSTPLSIAGEKPRSLLQLETRQIDALYDWARCRREVVQNRLLPTTLFLALMGLLANTSLGESAVQVAVRVAQDYFRDVGSLRWLVTYWRFYLLLVVFLLPGMLMFLLMNEAFTMDFIAQACLLARHERLSRQGAPLTQTCDQGVVGLLGSIGWWLLGLDNFVRRRRRK